MKISAAVLSVGNEVLRGSVVNTNAAFIGRELSAMGFEVFSHRVAPDSEEAIRFHLGELLRQADLILMCGGIGPTPDDVTREGVAAYFNVPLVFSKAQFSRIRSLYRRFGKPVPQLVKREAFFPKNAKPLLNRFGVALGFSVDSKGKIVIVLPGVPAELENMFFDVVRPLLKKRFPGTEPARRLFVKMTGIPEPEVIKKLGKGFFREPFDFGIYPSSGEVAVRIFCDDRMVLARLEKMIRSRLGDHIYAWEEVDLGTVVGRLLAKKKRTLALAESCTGGLLAAEITKCPGASAFFLGGTVAYHRTVKEKLGVAARTLDAHGEVSAEVAGELAASVRSRMSADYGIGITGVAGPGGGTRRKPVGLVYIGLAGPQGRLKVWEHRFWGDRNQVRRRAVIKALECLWRTVR